MTIEMIAGELVLPFRDEGGTRARFERLMALHQQRVLRTAYRLLGGKEDAQDCRPWRRWRKIRVACQAILEARADLDRRPSTGHIEFERDLLADLEQRAIRKPPEALLPLVTQPVG